MSMDNIDKNNGIQVSEGILLYNGDVERTYRCTAHNSKIAGSARVTPNAFVRPGQSRFARPGNFG